MRHYRLFYLLIPLGAMAGGLLYSWLTAPRMAEAGRNNSGTYVFPVPGVPFQTGTTISSSQVNTTFTDIGNEVTLSLDRNGRAGMLAPLLCSAGNAVNPSLSFIGSTSAGLYKAATNDVRMSISAADTTQWTTTSFNTLRGLTATQTQTNLAAITATANGTANGIVALGSGASQSGATNNGIIGVASGVASAVTTSGSGVIGVGSTAVNTPGVAGYATGNGNGVGGVGAGTGVGGSFTGGGTNGAGGSFANGVASVAGTRQDAVTLTNGDLNLSGVVNASPTVGFTNRLSPGHIAKAWGRVNIVTGTATLAEGVNVSSTFSFTAGGNLVVTFATAMANANYDVGVSFGIGGTTDSFSTVFPGVTNATATGFEVYATQTSNGTRVALNGTFQISFRVFARQGT